MAPQLSQYATVPGGALRMRSTSVAGIVRWQPWQRVADEPGRADALAVRPRRRS